MISRVLFPAALTLFNSFTLRFPAKASYGMGKSTPNWRCTKADGLTGGLSDRRKHRYFPMLCLAQDEIKLRHAGWFLLYVDSGGTLFHVIRILR
jgi:hypothetical protein